MAITLRQVKGTGLTYAEADENWAYLERTKHNRLNVSYEGEYFSPKITINSDGEIVAVEEQAGTVVASDLKGSVFAEDSSVMVDAIDNRIYASRIEGNLSGNVVGDLVGNVRGSVFADDSSLIIDGTTGQVSGSAIVGTLSGVSVQGNILAEDSTVLVEAYSGTINLNNTSIDSLLDVDTTSTSPVAGDVLKWDGSKWTAAAESGAAVSASNADLLDGFDGTYYLNYNNFSNTPALATVATTGSYNDLSDTPTVSTPIGVGQTWQNVTSSRVLNTNYTNTTGRPIMISIYCSGQPNHCEWELVIDGVSLGHQGVISVASAAMRATMSAIVPAGSVYRANNILNATLTSWAELR